MLCLQLLEYRARTRPMKIESGKIGFYTGSFDPMTLGHVNVLRQALNVCEHVHIGIGSNPGKTPLFTVTERLSLIQQVLSDEFKDQARRVTVQQFSGLAVDAAKSFGASVIIRGLRDSTDFDYEMQMAGMNSVLAPDVQTIFIPASSELRPITATLVRQIAALDGDISPFVPRAVFAALSKR